MNRCWQVFRRLVLTRPLVLAMLGMFYAVDAFLAIIVPDTTGNLWLGLAAVCAIPTIGVFALATERLSLVSVSAGELGVPRHASAVRLAQLCIVALFVGGPFNLFALLARTDPLPFAALMLAPAALGAALVMRGYVFVGLLIAIGLLNVRGLQWDWLANEYVQAGALVVSLVVLYRWLALPSIIEAQSAQRVMALADASHETTDDELSETFAVKPEEIDRYEQALSEKVMSSITGLERRLPEAALALGLGYETGISVKSLLKLIGCGLIALVAWHYLHGTNSEAAGYWIVTAVAALMLSTRTSSIYEAWRRTPNEQSVLTLTPRWPSESAVKRVFLRSLGRVQLSSWLAWGAISASAFSLRLITAQQVGTAAIVMLASFCGSSATLLLLLSRRSLKEWHWSTVIVLFSAIVGAALFAVGFPANANLSVFALVLILVPAVVALVALIHRPLQFPVAPVSRDQR